MVSLSQEFWKVLLCGPLFGVSQCGHSHMGAGAKPVEMANHLSPLIYLQGLPSYYSLFIFSDHGTLNLFEMYTLGLRTLKIDSFSK